MFLETEGKERERERIGAWSRKKKCGAVMTHAAIMHAMEVWI
jgi:hypothetical protein